MNLLCKCGHKPSLFTCEFLDPIYFNMGIQKLERRYFYACTHCGQQAFQPGKTKAAAMRQWNLTLNGKRTVYVPRSLNGWDMVQ